MMDMMSINGEAIETTDEHPFFVKDVGWIPAGELSSGDPVKLKSDEYVPIGSYDVIISLTKTAAFRVPDGLYDGNKILTEIKNVKTIGYTRQLKDFNAYAKVNGYKFVLKTRKKTKISKQLQKQIDVGNIIHEYIR